MLSLAGIAPERWKTVRRLICRRRRQAFACVRRGFLGDSASGGNFLIFFGDKGFVSLCIHQLGKLCLIGKLDANHHGRHVWVGVLLLWSGFQVGVGLYYFAGDGRVDFAYGFYRFDRAKRFSSLNFGAWFWKFNEHDVAEFVLSVIGDSDGADAVFGIDPFVLCSVAIRRWISLGFLSVIYPGPAHCWTVDFFARL